MRIIGGEFRSRRLKTLPGLATRPTPDILRETLFNVLAPVIEGSTFIDAYAGTGAVGIEALSRGAARVWFIESRRRAASLIGENLRSLAVADRGIVICGRVTQHLGRLKADIVFLDPPYELAREYDSALRILGVHPPSLVVVQHSSRFTLQETYGALRRTRTLGHSSNLLTQFLNFGNFGDRLPNPEIAVFR